MLHKLGKSKSLSLAQNYLILPMPLDRSFVFCSFPQTVCLSRTRFYCCGLVYLSYHPHFGYCGPALLRSSHTHSRDSGPAVVIFMLVVLCILVMLRSNLLPFGCRRGSGGCCLVLFGCLLVLVIIIIQHSNCPSPRNSRKLICW